jgi:hypothetical protein
MNWAKHEIVNLLRSGYPSSTTDVVMLVESAWNLAVNIADFLFSIKQNLLLELLHQPITRLGRLNRKI